MAETTTRSDAPLEETVRLHVGASLSLDVAFCDLVKAVGPGHDGPYELRFRGTRQPDGKRVRFFAPLIQIEGALLHARAMRQAVHTAAAVAGDKASMLAVPLDEHALTITKARKGNGEFTYEVAVRDGRAAVDLQQYLQALKEAGEQAAPMLTGMGYAVGAAEVISVAGELVAMRTHRHTRQQVTGGGHG